MPANENLYTHEKETDILFCLNISLYIFLFLFLFCSETIKKELWDCTQENTKNYEPKAEIICCLC